MVKPIVSISTYDDGDDTLRKAINLCDGLKDLKQGDHILIKPNLVGWDFDYPVPPYGMLATTAVIYALVRMLFEEGFNRITIGEGPLMIPNTMGQAMYKILGYEPLRERYGVRLIDFNEGKFEKVSFGEFSLSISEDVLAADKIINVPVLKTHNQTKVSLGLKNLKGCLNKQSKMFCHGKVNEDLDWYFPHLMQKLPLALTIIDGIYALQRGPSYTGEAMRKNLIIASTDPLACDIVGAEIMDYRADDIPHLRNAAEFAGRSCVLEDIEIKGEKIQKHRQFLDYDFEWTPENTGPMGFKKKGITGLAIRKYDNTLCTGCSITFTPIVVLAMSAFKGEPFPGVELVTGKVQEASPGFEKTVLYGQCACHKNKDNPNIKKKIEVKGCPPDLNEYIEKIEAEGIPCNKKDYAGYRNYLVSRYKEEDGFDPGHFKEQVTSDV